MHGVSDTVVTPAFVTKLWALVEDPSTDHLISWDTSGRSFHVYDQLQFAKEVLPLYFKHGNIASFIRQLNMYGFRKVVQVEHGGLKMEKDDMEFQHPFFIRGNEALVSQIKRKPPSAAVKEGESRVHKDDVNKVLTDMQSLRGKQESMNNKLESMKRENEALWREVASLRQKHTQQQQIVNKLIQFLVTMVQKKPGMGVSRRRPLMINDSTEREGSRPAKLARQYSLESVGGTHYTVDMPDTPSTPLTAGLSRQGGVTIREVHDSVQSPGEIGPPTQISGGMVLNNDPMEPLVVHNSQNVDAFTAAPQTLDEYLQATNQTAQRTAKQATKPIKTEAVYLPPSYVTVVTNANASNTTKPLMVDVTPLATQGTSVVTDATVPGMAPLLTQTAGSVREAKPSTSLALVMDKSPSSSLNLPSAKDTRFEVNEHLDNIDSDLEALKDMLASGTYSLDANTLLGLFNPEGPVPQTPDHLLNLDEHPLSGFGAAEKEENVAGSIVGNELVQYSNPTDDLSKLLGLDDDTGVRLDTNQPIFPELESDLNTPQLNLDGTDSLAFIKQEGNQMEEVD